MAVLWPSQDSYLRPKGTKEASRGKASSKSTSIRWRRSRWKIDNLGVTWTDNRQRLLILFISCEWPAKIVKAFSIKYKCQLRLQSNRNYTIRKTREYQVIALMVQERQIHPLRCEWSLHSEHILIWFSRASSQPQNQVSVIIPFV